MPIATREKKKVFFAIPKRVLEPFWKIEINGTTVAIRGDASRLLSGFCEMPSLQAVGAFEFILDNFDGRYVNVFNLKDVTKIYINYSDGTSQRFEGHVRTLRYRTDSGGHTVIIQGNDYTRDLLSITVSERYTTATTISQLVKDIRDNYFPNHSSDNTNIENITVTDTPTWSHRKALNAIQDLEVRARNKGVKISFFVDKDKKWHLFEEGSRTVTDEYIVYSSNIMSMETMTTLDGYANKVYQFGADIEGLTTLKMNEDTDDQVDFEIEELVDSNTNLVTMDAITAEAQSKLAKYVTIEQFGNSQIIGAPGCIPGYDINVINHFCNVMGVRRLQSVRHNFSSSGFISEVEFQEEEKGLTTTMVDRIKKEGELENTRNPYKMEGTQILTFKSDDYGEDYKTPNSDASLETLQRCIVWDDALIMEANEITSIATSKIFNTGKDITQLVVNVSGSNLESAEKESWLSIRVSDDGGYTWDSVTEGELHTLSKTGKLLVVELTITSLTTKIKGVGIQFK